MGIVVYTLDLTEGVIAGVVMTTLVFGWKISRISATSATWDDGVKVHFPSLMHVPLASYVPYSPLKNQFR
jgi:MFS superfamily sulfate permease-like transporter